jgi:2-haloacid dehalogenase
MVHENMTYDEAAADAIFDAIRTWGPHPDVPGGLSRLAERYPLVILSNADDEEIPHNVAQLGAPFHAVLTAQQARAYKPRLAAFEYMLDALGCDVDDIVHVSASLRYDLMPAHDLGIRNKVYVNRGYEPSTPYYGYREITTIEELPALFKM